MRDSSSLHKKVQEMCDCYATNDPLKEMSDLKNDIQEEDAATKWIALAVLHGINNNAEEISLETSPDGKVKVVAEYRRTELPSPDGATGEKVVQALRDIIHAESSQGQSTLALGVRNSSMDLQVKTREEAGSNKVTIKFP